MSTLLTILACAALATEGEAPVVELSATVTGNQEQPRVLYIVPWRDAEGPDSLYQDFASRIDNLLEPIDRESFRRELKLRRQFEQASDDSLHP